jgi:diguanylate cyclase (GGDEF)-like protein
MGVSDFVTKGAGSAELLTRLNNLLSLTNAKENLEADRERLVQDPVSGLYSRKYLELQAAQALSHAARHGIDVSVMVLGFDGFDGMCQRLGVEVAEEVCNRFGKMLAGKVRHEDSLGHYGMGQFAVVSPGTAPAFCATFAERVREAVEMAKLTIRGETVALTVSIGLASTPSDTVPSAGACSIWPANGCIRPWLPAAIARKPAACGRPRGPYRSITPWSCWPPGGSSR